MKTDKVKIVVEKIEEVFSDAQSLTVADLNDYLEFDCNRYLRMLCRRGFLIPVYREGEKRIAGFKRTATWPPPDGFFEGGAIGFAYYLQTWFQYYLQAAVTVN